MLQVPTVICTCLMLLKDFSLASSFLTQGYIFLWNKHRVLLVSRFTVCHNNSNSFN
jgi:hypothetical protein